MSLLDDGRFRFSELIPMDLMDIIFCLLSSGVGREAAAHCGTESSMK